MNQLLYKPTITITKHKLPESKSILNRLLFIAAFTKTQSYLTNIKTNQDIQTTLNILRTLGKTIIYKPNLIKINNSNLKTNKLIYTGNSGITTRITCVLTLLTGKKGTILKASKRMQDRPMKSIFVICQRLLKTVTWQFLKASNKLPIIINNKPHLQIPQQLHIDCKKSSQILTALLLVLPLLIKKPITLKLYNVITSQPYILLVIDLLQRTHINIKLTDTHTILIKPSKYTINTHLNTYIEKDNSAIPYLIFSALNTKTAIKFKQKTLTSKQLEIKILKILNKLNFKFKKHTQYRLLNCHNNYNNNNNIKYITINCGPIIDTAMLIPTLLKLTQLKKIKLFNIYNWNLKECKRLTAISKELRKKGMKTKAGKNWIKIKTYTKYNNTTTDTYKDHRMFLSLFMLKGIINHPNTIKKSFPCFLT